MRIFSRKAFAFQGPDGEVAAVRPLDFAEVPDWVAKSLMWQWALKDGDVQEVVSKAVEDGDVQEAADEPVKGSKAVKGVAKEH
jgi:hypothetical protein